MQTSTALKIAAGILLIACLSAFALFTYQPGAGPAVSWEAGDDDPVLSFFPAGDGLFLVTGSNVSFVNETGHELWALPMAGGRHAALGGDGRLYVGTTDRGLASIDEGGNASFTGMADIRQPPLVDRAGTVYIRSLTRLTAYGRDGAELWSDAVAISDPAIDAGDNAYYLVRLPSRPSDVYLVSRSPDGRQRWSMLFDRSFADTLLVPAASGVYVFSPLEGEVSRISSDGGTSWKYYKPYMGQYQALSSENGHLFLVYQRGTVHALGVEGYLIGKYTLESSYDSNETALPAASGDTLFTVGPDPSPSSAVLYATALNGSVLWKARLNSSTPCRIYASGDIVCVATELQKNSRAVPVLYIFNEGRLRRAQYPGDGQTWDQVSIVGETVYALTAGGKLYSLKGA